MRKRIFLPLVLSALLLAACGSFMPVHEFKGTATVNAVSAPLLFRFTTYGELVRGTHFLADSEEPTGRTEGTLSGTKLEMTLISGDCVYDFKGSVDAEELLGTFSSRTTACGPGGSWALKSVGS